MPDTIGFIGLGIMGRPMAHNLLKASFPLVVQNRHREVADEFLAAGAQAIALPRDIAASCNVVITIPTRRRSGRTPGGAAEEIGADFSHQAGGDTQLVQSQPCIGDRAARREDGRPGLDGLSRPEVDVAPASVGNTSRQICPATTASFMPPRFDQATRAGLIGVERS